MAVHSNYVFIGIISEI